MFRDGCTRSIGCWALIAQIIRHDRALACPSHERVIPTLLLSVCIQGLIPEPSPYGLRGCCEASGGGSLTAGPTGMHCSGEDLRDLNSGSKRSGTASATSVGTP